MSKINISSEVISTPINDTESVILHLETQRYYSLNETGTFIWNGLKDGESLAEIAKGLESEYDVSDALSYINTFLKDLSNEGLLNTYS